MTSRYLNSIKNAAKRYDVTKALNADSNTNLRLTKLVDKHGIDVVSAAAGLKPSSIVQYTTRKTAPQISEAAIIKAEHVLSQF